MTVPDTVHLVEEESMTAVCHVSGRKHWHLIIPLTVENALKIRNMVLTTFLLMFQENLKYKTPSFSVYFKFSLPWYMTILCPGSHADDVQTFLILLSLLQGYRTDHTAGSLTD